jgi:hypothetical protein
MIFDLLENTGIVIMLSSWPQQLHGLANATVFFFWIKWTLAGICILLILLGLIKSKLLKQ